MPETLAAFPRDNGQRLVVDLAEHEGRAYIALRLIRADVPAKCLGIRLTECAALAQVLERAATHPTFVPPRHSRPEPRDAQPLPTVSPSPVPFDECGGEHG